MFISDKGNREVLMSNICDRLIKIMEDHPEKCSVCSSQCTINIIDQDVWIANLVFNCDTYPNKGSFGFWDKFRFKRAFKKWSKRVDLSKKTRTQIEVEKKLDRMEDKLDLEANSVNPRFFEE